MINKYLISGRDDGPIFRIGVGLTWLFTARCSLIFVFDIFYFKLSLIDVFNEITKPRTI